MRARWVVTWPDLWLGAWWWHAERGLLVIVLGVGLLLEFAPGRRRRAAAAAAGDHPRCPEVVRILKAVVAEGDARLVHRVTSRVLELRRLERPARRA